MNEQQQKFEKWAVEKWDLDIEPAREESADTYMEGETETAWMGWQAAIASQAPRQALSDLFILMTASQHDADSREIPDAHVISFARAIEAASGPNAALVEALKKIALWELPATGKFWPTGGAVSYEAEYGSNGARDYIRQVAFQALAAVGEGGA